MPEICQGWSEGEGDCKSSESNTLRALLSEFNHSVRPFGIWLVTDGSIIAMLTAGNYLTSFARPGWSSMVTYDTAI